MFVLLSAFAGACEGSGPMPGAPLPQAVVILPLLAQDLPERPQLCLFLRRKAALGSLRPLGLQSHGVALQNNRGQNGYAAPSTYFIPGLISPENNKSRQDGNRYGEGPGKFLQKPPPFPLHPLSPSSPSNIIRRGGGCGECATFIGKKVPVPHVLCLRMCSNVLECA